MWKIMELTPKTRQYYLSMCQIEVVDTEANLYLLGSIAVKPAELSVSIHC